MSLYIRILICLICLSLTGAAVGKTSQEIIEGCWAEGAHPAMAACVERYAKAADLSLEKVEIAIRKNISVNAEAYAYSAEAKKALEASITSFRAYRLAECGFREVISRTGNASESVKLACEAELNEKRASQLHEDNFWFK